MIYYNGRELTFRFIVCCVDKFISIHRHTHTHHHQYLYVCVWHVQRVCSFAICIFSAHKIVSHTSVHILFSSFVFLRVANKIYWKRNAATNVPINTEQACAIWILWFDIYLLTLQAMHLSIMWYVREIRKNWPTSDSLWHKVIDFSFWLTTSFKIICFFLLACLLACTTDKLINFVLDANHKK